MIKAGHKRWARLLFNQYINRSLRKHFSHFYLVNEPPRSAGIQGLMITPNHFSWWDGFFIDYVMRHYSTRKLHIMMLEEQLKRYWFFRKLGAYSVDLRNPRSILESIQYTQRILHDHENFVVYYPQGEIRPYDERPLKLKTGLQKVLKDIKVPTVVVPAAFKIQFGNEPKPDIFARFSSPLPGREIEKDFGIFTHEFCKNMNELDKASRETAYVTELFK